MPSKWLRTGFTAVISHRSGETKTPLLPILLWARAQDKLKPDRFVDLTAWRNITGFAH